MESIKLYMFRHRSVILRESTRKNALNFSMIMWVLIALTCHELYFMVFILLYFTERICWLTQ